MIHEQQSLPTHATPRSHAPAASAVDESLHLAMVAWMVAGIQTHYQNVRPVAEQTADVSVIPIEIRPWKPDGVIERLPVLPQRLRSTMRTFERTLPLYRVGSMNVVWTQSLVPLAPFLFTRAALSRIPVVFDADSTPRLLASFGAQYAEQVSGPTLKRRIVDGVLAAAARRCAAIVCWSSWAARSFVDDYAVPEDHIHVIPPGVDVNTWARPTDVERRGPTTRLLFVGADFERKGGDLLLDIWRRHFRERSELHLVTRAAVAPEPGLFIYRDLMPNDPGLLKLYHTCDALVLPTRGDCFSLASIEAMAASLPVITTAVGGIPEILRDGVTGYLIPPNDGAALYSALASLIEDDERAATMGRAGREVAVQRFDAARNAQQLIALLRSAAAHV